jgi:hypothetical protein
MVPSVALLCRNGRGDAAQAAVRGANRSATEFMQ